jgi:DNA primase
MSSFINSSKHFASVKKSIIALRYREKEIMEFKIARLLPELSVFNNRNQEMAEEKINELIDTIIDIQVICVCLQYKHHYIGTLDKKINETQEHIKGNLETGEILSKIALFKAIQSILYQIELDYLTVLRPLSPKEEIALKFMDILKEALMYNIIRDIDEYDKAEWSIM